MKSKRSANTGAWRQAGSSVGSCLEHGFNSSPRWLDSLFWSSSARVKTAEQAADQG